MVCCDGYPRKLIQGGSQMAGGGWTSQRVVALVTILQRNKTSGTYRDRGNRRFITGNGLPCYEGHKVPPSATCKPETQESWWYDSAESEGLRVKGANGRSPSLSLKAWSPHIGGQEKMESQFQQRGWTPPSSVFLFSPCPRGLGRGALTLKALIFTVCWFRCSSFLETLLDLIL